MRSTILCWLLSCGTLSAAPPHIETIAGTGQAGYSGDGRPAALARLHEPFHCFLAQEDLYIADAFNHAIRKMSLITGQITTVAGSGAKGYSGDGGPAIRATMNEPYAVVRTLQGDFYIADRLNAVIRKVDSNGHISTIAGNGRKGYSGDGGKATDAQFVEPNDCFLDGRGGLLIADVGDWRIRRVDLTTGIISTFAGIGRTRSRVNRKQIGDGGPAKAALVVGARAVCVDGLGNTYIAEREGNAVRRVDARGIITTIAGTGAKGYSGDGGDARMATFNGPKGIRCDDQGNIYLVDAENNAIRRIDAGTNVVATVAGGRRGSDGDGGPATQAGLAQPHGCVVDALGAVYIADTLNHRVRRVSPPSPTPNLPLRFADDFERGSERWQPTDAKAWKIVQTPHGKVYSLFQQSDYKPPHRSPFNFSLIKNLMVSNFVFDAKVRSTTADYPHRDMCLVFGYRDPAHFYYVHLGKKTDDHANQIFIVNGAPRTKISTRTTPGTNWDNNWHKVRIIRDSSNGVIEVYFDDMAKPIMAATDKTFPYGQVGVGSFDDTGDYADVHLYGMRIILE